MWGCQLAVDLLLYPCIHAPSSVYLPKHLFPNAVLWTTCAYMKLSCTRKYACMYTAMCMYSSVCTMSYDLYCIYCVCVCMCTCLCIIICACVPTYICTRIIIVMYVMFDSFMIYGNINCLIGNSFHKNKEQITLRALHCNCC